MHAQEINKSRIKTINISENSIIIDTLSIQPQSLQIIDFSGNIIDTSLYRINYIDSKIIFDTTIINQKLKISYCVFPFSFSKLFVNKDKERISEESLNTENSYIFEYKENTDAFMLDGLRKNGSISRGLSFGNNQDVVVNSNMNLQLSGMLSSDIEILAAITDNNIPLQPEGNTQHIQEFDKVFIQLSNKTTKLIVGDIELSKPPSYFMNFNKKAQGLTFSTLINQKKQTNKFAVKTSASLSKGKYARNEIIGLEGNQGPYKLSGSSNEKYIIVLAGTEKVYIDGKLLSRGQTNDYVIDYNTAELTFTPANLITKDKRIVIEFEYSEKSYARAMFFLGTQYKTKKLNLRLNFFSESDLKSQSLDQELDDNDKQILNNIGDSLHLAFTNSFDTVAFSSNEILYKMTDTTVNSVYYDTIFIYSTNSDSAKYRLGFADVGKGNGNYIQEKSSANGRVFQWISPLGGIPQGKYEPVKMLHSPKKKQMYTASIDYNISKSSIISTEIALSNEDHNTFSDNNDNNNIGIGIKTKFINKIFLARKDSDWVLTTAIDYELTDKYFSPVERYKNVEFERNWNISEQKTSNNAHKSGISFQLNKNSLGKIRYMLNYLNRGEYSAWQNNFNTEIEKRGFHIMFQGSYLKSDDAKNSSEFIRHNAMISKKLKWFTLGLKENNEYNTFRNKETNSLLSNSFSFFEWEAFAMNPDTSKIKYSLNYKIRDDKLPQNNSFHKASRGESIGFNFNLSGNNKNRLKLNASYRKLTISDSLLTNNKAENTLVGRLEYFTKRFKGFIVSNTFYEVGSGIEVKKEYSYIEVADGQGVYSWTDFNSNGIKELDEFEVAAFQDQADYIRIFTPTDEYVKTYYNNFSESIKINFAAIWKKKKGLRKIISKISNNTVYRIEHKTTDDNFSKAYNPFSNNVEDESLMTLNSTFRNNLYFNKANPKYGFDISYFDRRNKILLINGFDTRTNNKIGFAFRWNLTKKFTIKSVIYNGEKQKSSEYFSNKNFHIEYYQLEPTLIYQPTNYFRISLLYKFITKDNIEAQISEKSENHNFGTEIKYNIVKKGNIILNLNYISIKFNGDQNTSIAYEMVEGLKSGDNMTWSVGYQRTLSNNMQLSINYNGRKSPDVKIIHVGAVQLRAYF